MSRARIFRSTIPGRAAAQVGRWHAARKPQHDALSDIPPPTLNGETWPRSTPTHALPTELEDLSPEDVNAVVYFSDNSHEGITESLRSFHNASAVGMIATSTPFVTGRPFTLFHNKDIHSSGAVGMCINGFTPPRHNVVFPALKAITRACMVTSSEGNLVHTLDNKNPTEILLHGIERHKLMVNKDVNLAFRESQFYLWVAQEDKSPEQVFRINSGDPSRGTIALEGDLAPPVGSRVQMLHLPENYLDSRLPVLNRPNCRVNMNFLTVPSEPPPTLLTPLSIGVSRIPHAVGWIRTGRRKDLGKHQSRKVTSVWDSILRPGGYRY
ncbi:unnamed protein product [Somion occarium]|uniref:FIST domain-containing protein n=1 Tax=Somion occarium TaxID=3059160 RepID=A0ABP1E0C9_9APHY